MGNAAGTSPKSVIGIPGFGRPKSVKSVGPASEDRRSQASNFSTKTLPIAAYKDKNGLNNAEKAFSQGSNGRKGPAEPKQPTSSREENTSNTTSTTQAFAGVKQRTPRLSSEDLKSPAWEYSAAMLERKQTADFIVPPSEGHQFTLDDSAMATFDFRMTEGQVRRDLMADCEFVCSPILDHVFVSGFRVATNWDMIEQCGITRIVNCSAAVVESCFVDKPGMKYLSLSMYDGRDDDISWFVCQVIHFVNEGRLKGEKTLIHCEKGISRSCSFAIAYTMWLTGKTWKDAFNYVKSRRKVCAPNTAFTCQLIEIGDMFYGETKHLPLVLRCAYHLPHDPYTPVLKICRNVETRQLLSPCTSALDPRAAFVIKQSEVDECVQSNTKKIVYVWKGEEASNEALAAAVRLADLMCGVFVRGDGGKVVVVKQNEETKPFLDCLEQNGPFNLEESTIYEDYLDDAVPLTTRIEEAVMHGAVKRNDSRNSNSNSHCGSLPRVKSENSISSSSSKSYSSQPNSSRRFITDVSSAPEPLVMKSAKGKMGFKLNLGNLSKPASSVGLGPPLSGLGPPLSGRNSAKNSARIVQGGGTSLSPRRGDGSKKDKPVSQRFSLRNDCFDDDAELGSADISPYSHRDAGAQGGVSSMPTTETFNDNSRINGIANTMAETQSPIIMDLSARQGNSPQTPRTFRESPVDPISPRSNNSSSKRIVLTTKRPNAEKDLPKSPKSMLEASDDPEYDVTLARDVSMTSVNRSYSTPVVGSSQSAKEPTSNDLQRNQGPHQFLVLNQANSKVPSARDSSNGTGRSLTARPVCKEDSFTIIREGLDLTKVELPERLRLKGPADVGLERGPTPIMDMPLTNSARILTHCDSEHMSSIDEMVGDVSMLNMGGGDDSVVDLGHQFDESEKPSLYQAVKIKKTYQWEAMGVYDDGDLIETSCLLLHTGGGKSFLWFGSNFFAKRGGISVESSDTSLMQWAEKISRGDLPVDTRSLFLLKKNGTKASLTLCRQGDEPEIFWQTFAEGY